MTRSTRPSLDGIQVNANFASKNGKKPAISLVILEGHSALQEVFLLFLLSSFLNPEFAVQFLSIFIKGSCVLWNFPIFPSKFKIWTSSFLLIVGTKLFFFFFPKQVAY